MNDYRTFSPVRPNTTAVNNVPTTADQFESILALQQLILNSIAQDKKENEILDQVCQLCESMVDNAIGSVMLKSPNDGTLNVINAPSMPAEAQSRFVAIEPGEGNGSCAQAVYKQAATYVYDTSSDPTWRNIRDLAAELGVRSCWSVPVYNRRGQAIGTFALASFEHRAPTSFHERLLKMCSTIVSIMLEREELRKEALTDKLTGLWNRTKLDKALYAQRASYSLNNDTYAVMLLDIDHFKQVNDQYGHLVGDTVLQEVASILKQETRARDIVGRWGGEEFMVVLPNAGNGRALEIAESIRMAIKNHFFGKAGHITISIGVCEVSEKLRTLEVIDLADRALYKAKDSGRDRVCMSYKKGPINPHAIDAKHIEVKQQEKLHAPA